MPLPLAVPIAASVIGAGAKYLLGNKQGKLADQYAKTPRPAYEISKGIYENVNAARNRVGSGLPGEGFLRSRFDRILSNTGAAASRYGYGAGDILSTISSAASSQMDKEAELTYKGAQYRDQAGRELANANTALAGEENKAWDWNKKTKYLDDMAAASALRNASINNKYGALTDILKTPMLFGNKSGLGSTETPTAMTPISSNGVTAPNIQIPDQLSFERFKASNPKYAGMTHAEFKKLMAQSPETI